MAQAQEVKDQSMEDILQSIKRIIADDDKEPAANANTPPVSQGSGSEVLELHDLVEPVKEETPVPVDSEKEKLTQQVVDVLAVIDQGLTREHEEAAAVAVEAPATVEALISQEVIQNSASALRILKEQTKPVPQEVTSAEEAPQLMMRSGVTVEELVIEALRPELRAWLNTHMTEIVERMVAEEIKKISN